MTSPLAQPRRRFALVFNARAGLAMPRLLDGVLTALKSAGADVATLPTRSADEATAQVADAARSGHFDAVIAAGGDGTFRAVAAGAAASALPVGFIPLGTGNVLGFELGLKRRARDLARGLMADPTVPIRAGLVNGRRFFLMVGAGFDASVVSKLNYKAKRALGRAAYAPAVLRVLAAPPQMFDVEIDGAHERASWIICSRAGRYGGSFRLTGEAALGVEGMVAVIIKAATRRQLVGAALALAAGRLAHPQTRPRCVDVRAAHHVRIAPASPVAIEVDGDDEGLSPVEIRADGPVVHVIVPAAYVAEITNRHTNHVVSGS